jgi:hypothetical protein
MKMHQSSALKRANLQETAAIKSSKKALAGVQKASNDDTRDLLASMPSAIDLDKYVPAYFIWIANKLTRGASQHYLNLFGVGSEVWRCMVLLAIHDTISAQ